MNGPTVLVLAVGAAMVLFIGIVALDRWLDRRERAAMYAEQVRYSRAITRLGELHKRDAGRTRIGHPHE